jgi:hypothetical protein
MRRRHAHKHRAGFDLLAIDLSSLPTRQSARVVGIPRPCIASCRDTHGWSNAERHGHRPRAKTVSARHLSDADPTFRPVRSVLLQGGSPAHPPIGGHRPQIDGRSRAWPTAPSPGLENSHQTPRQTPVASLAPDQGRSVRLLRD